MMVADTLIAFRRGIFISRTAFFSRPGGRRGADLVHLTARGRRDVLRFPSLKFLTRLPYRQARRQRLRHRFLFALRTLGVILLVLAFTRPVNDGASAVALGGSGRAVVIALDRSCSMAYAGIWSGR